MGCWNKTCAVTQFPLFAGDKTVSFVIVETPRFEGRMPVQPTEQHAYWDILPMPIYGEYNDYGGQDDDAGQEAKYADLQTFFKDRLTRISEQTKYIKAPVNPFENGETLDDSIHGNHYAMVSPPTARATAQPHLHIARIMIARPIFDLMTAGVEVTYPKKRFYSKREMIDTFNGFTEYLKSEQDKIRADALEQYPGDDEDTIAKRQRSVATSVAMMRFNPDLVVDAYTSSLSGDTYTSPLRAVLYYAFCRGMSGNTTFTYSEWKRAMHDMLRAEDVVESFLFKLSMNTLRKTIVPQTGEGSQDGFEPIHAKLVEAMAAMIEADRVRFGDDEEEQEEEDET
jgi:hypothetical protein